MVNSTFPPRFKQTFTFQPFRLFAIHFKIILIRLLCISGFQSISDLLFIPIGEDSSLVNGPVEMSEQGRAYIKRFGVACSAIRSTNHCYQSVARILIIIHTQNHPVALWKDDLSLSKVHKGPLSYAEGSPLTLRNHFIQPYRTLDTLFSEYY